MNRRRFVGALAGMAATFASNNANASSRVDYAAAGATLVDTPPADEGFYFPAEWQRHERTLMQFLPASSWYEKDSDEEWAAVANAVAEFEPVTMAVEPKSMTRSESLLSSDIERVEWPMNDGWSRDSGPIILVNGSKDRRVAGFEFNGWGGKHPPWDQDALIKARFAAHLDMALHPAPLVLEGGAVAVDGEGTLITTEQCLLNANRNPVKTKAEVEAVLRGWLGVETVIWLPKGLEPDPITDGHVDGIAAFAGAGVVLLHATDDRSDPNYEITQDAKNVLINTPDARGRRLQVIEIPLTSFDLVHMNFYICNGGVIVPVTGNAREDDAPLAILRDVFPDHQVIPVTGRLIAKGGGGVHCITQQVPAV